MTPNVDVRAFMYHDVRDMKDTAFKTRLGLKSFLSTLQFKNQLKYITERYEIISAYDLPSVSRGKYAILTFDDGLKDHYNVASLLADMNITGAFFIPSNAIKNRKVIQSHKIQFILASLPEKEVVTKIFEGLKCAKEERKYLWDKFSTSKWKDNWWTKEMVFTTNILRLHKNRDEITNELFKEYVEQDEAFFCEDFYLKEHQIKDMVSAGMDIGGHGHLSEPLTSLNQEDDVSSSIKFIRKFHNKDVIYSYPNGDYNKETIKVMNKYNCKFAFTTKHGDIRTNSRDLELPRHDAPRSLPL